MKKTAVFLVVCASFFWEAGLANAGAHYDYYDYLLYNYSNHSTFNPESYIYRDKDWNYTLNRNYSNYYGIYDWHLRAFNDKPVHSGKRELDNWLW